MNSTDNEQKSPGAGSGAMTPAGMPLVILSGPTAVGKTALSLELAKRIGGEIISADSMQVYRGCDIGSAKIRPEEMKGVRHHLIDVLNPDEPFNVMIFQQMAKEAAAEIAGRGHIPLVTGGTGFYIQALLYDIRFSPEKDGEAVRASYEAIAREEGNERLYERLKEIDPASARIIHKNNTKRLIRALEYYDETGEPISAHNERERARTSPYRFAYFFLNDDREKIYERIDRRVDQMLEDGLVEEVRGLHNLGYRKDLVSMQGLGYKEILEYLDGTYPLEEAVRLIKRDTRHFAKRQLTWARREKELEFFDRRDYADENAICDAMTARLREMKIIE